MADAQKRWPQNRMAGRVELTPANIAAGEADLPVQLQALPRRRPARQDRTESAGHGRGSTAGKPEEIVHTITAGVPAKGMLDLGTDPRPRRRSRRSRPTSCPNTGCRGLATSRRIERKRGSHAGLRGTSGSGSTPRPSRAGSSWWHRLASFFLHLCSSWAPGLVVGGNPPLRVDLPARRLYAFGAIFTASDTILLLLILLFLAFALFFFTSLFGRLWCGYACPQTVFLEEWIRPLERWIEGDRNARMRRDNGPMDARPPVAEGGEVGALLAAAFVISMAMVSYFAGAKELWTGQAGPSEYALVGIFTVALFLDFAWFREQFCNYLCPYARFQSALIDDDTLQISYDPARGEPRGGTLAKTDRPLRRLQPVRGGLPAGHRHPQGFQLECIACARCIDACDARDGQARPPEPVEYTTLAAQQGRRAHRLRPRTVVYGGHPDGAHGGGDPRSSPAAPRSRRR